MAIEAHTIARRATSAAGALMLVPQPNDQVAPCARSTKKASTGELRGKDKSLHEEAEGDGAERN